MIGIAASAMNQTKEDDRRAPPCKPNLHQDRKCFNVQWLCFLLGIFVIPSAVAIVLPFFSAPRFKTKSYFVGWICNIVLLVAEIVIIVTVAVVLSKKNKDVCDSLTPGNHCYTYCNPNNPASICYVG